MSHEHTACRDKCMNLLWVLWLITAPDKHLFADVLQHIRSFTEDQGGDLIGTALIFPKFVGVQLPGDMVAHGLTFPFAVHIPGWNHCCSRFLAEMRSLTKCFRNEDFYFRTSGENADAPFRSFTAGFAKWRDETISEVVCQLAALASIVQQGFLGAFHNTKPEGLDEACKDVELMGFHSGSCAIRAESRSSQTMVWWMQPS